VYNITRFKDLHPGGASVFAHEDIGALYISSSQVRKLEYMFQLVRMLLRLSTAFIAMKFSCDRNTLAYNLVPSRGKGALYILGSWGSSVMYHMQNLRGLVLGTTVRTSKRYIRSTTYLWGTQRSGTSNQSHRRLQAAMRKFMDEVVTPDALVGSSNRC